ncbi:MAG TPA: UDP-N-acetylmuramate dehydrogenase [Candidatus Binataceae bacterium]|nr:UDP-N-acetylmuramate dehydrogenase [Candidatus Binataceae bacterium]
MNMLEHTLRERFGGRLQVQFPLAALTSFQIGGPADLFIEVEDEAELVDAIAAAHHNGVSHFCLGAGTNLLVSDRGMRGLVIKLGIGFTALTIDGIYLTAGAAAQFGAMVRTAVEYGLAGLEFGEGIPGTVGGGLVMNAGAFGGEMARVVTTVHGVTSTGEPRALTRDEVKFAYRRTELPPRFIITRVDFQLNRGDRDGLLGRVAELKAKRASRQPKGVPNAGSVFKNPPGNFAGRLLEGAGLKGAQLGGAAFSERHANFIVNLGGARAEEVRALIDMARHRVKEASGVWLDPEVRLVGEW